MEAQGLIKRFRGVTALNGVSLSVEPAKAVAEVAESIRRLKAIRLTCLLIEQNVEVAMGLADQVYVMDHSRVVFGGPPAAIRERGELRAACLGIA